MLLPDYKDLLVTAAGQVDPAVISVELLEKWYCVKVHGVPIKHYLTCGLALAREEIELGTEYQLKRNPAWFQSSEELHNRNQKGSTIVIVTAQLSSVPSLTFTINMANNVMKAIKTNSCLARPHTHNHIRLLRVNRLSSSFLFFFRFDILVDGYTILDRNISSSLSTIPSP